MQRHLLLLLVIHAVLSATPRAVVYGTPARSAAGRTPHAPPATSPITPPTVSAVSSRQASTNAGSSAWLTPHGPQRCRGTKIFRHRPAVRTYRQYPDQNPSRLAHDGQSRRGNSTARPAAT